MRGQTLQTYCNGRSQTAPPPDTPRPRAAAPECLLAP